MAVVLATGCGSALKRSPLLDKPAPVSGKVAAITAPASVSIPAASTEAVLPSDSADAVDDTISDDPAELIQDARQLCKDSNFAAADSELRVAIKEIETIDAEGQSERFPATRYIDDIITIYNRNMPAAFPIPDEIAVSAFQWQLGQSLDSMKVPPSDSARLYKIESQKGAATYDMPLVWNDQVLGAMEFFIKNRRNTIDKWFPRASKYLPYMQQMFADSGLPRDLAYLPLIESAFNPVAYSCARASGIWQFIASTGSLYGLRRSYWVDERRDPVRSTLAAVRYFKKLWGNFGDWNLCLAAYNCGEGGVSRAIARCKTNDFWKLRLPAQTRGYVPTYMAAVTIAKNPKDFNVPMPAGDTLAPDTVLINDCIRLEDIAQGIGIPADSLKKLNPHLLRWCTPPDASTVLYVPSGYKASFASFYSLLPDEKKVRWCHYQIKRSDNMQNIAARFNIPVTDIMAINRLRKPRVATGRFLFLPLPASSSTDVASVKPAYIPPVNAYTEEHFSDAVVYRVHRGDSMRKIARRYHITLAQLYRWNNFPRTALLRPGRTIVIRPASEPEADASVPESAPMPSGRYVVQSGDTPFSIARHAGIRLNDLLAWNSIDTTNPSIKAGDTLRLTGPQTASRKTGPTPTAIVSAKSTTTALDLAAVKDSRNSYTVRSGDNLYQIACKHSLTLQALLDYNHFSKRTVIHPGMTIVIPGDTGSRNITQVSAPKVVYYRVRRGDTLPTIASNFGIPIEKLSSDNNLSPDSAVLPGEIIKVVKGAGR